MEFETMQLGRALLKRDGINSLRNALHPKHGLAWTDGQAVYLSPSPADSRPESTPPLRLGQFDGVQSLQWSCELEQDSYTSHGSMPRHSRCYLCVVHASNVSIWSVRGIAPDLSFKQIRKINACPIPQGCLWNPSRDVLCLLKPTQCSFYFRHASNKGSYCFPPIDSGRICCGCWSHDGKKLIVGLGAIILIYRWNDIDKSISDYLITAWKIPCADGQIRSLVSISDHKLACTTEVPLDQLCKAHNGDMFEVPEVGGGSSDSDSIHAAWEISSCSLSASSSSDGDRPPLTSRVLSHQVSPTEALFNLRRTPQSVVANASSQLLVFSIAGDGTEAPSKLCSENTHGILVPDILHYDSSLNMLMVGSNTQNILQVFTLKDQLIKLYHIQLENHERLKGICSLPLTPSDLSARGVLAMIGRQNPHDFAFLSTSSSATYDLSLKVISLPKSEGTTSAPSCIHEQSPGLHHPVSDIPANLFNEIQLPNGNARVHLLRFNSLHSDHMMPKFPSIQKSNGHVAPSTRKRSNGHVAPSSRKECNNPASSGSSEFNLLLPSNSSKDTPAALNKLILDEDSSEELEVHQADFASMEPRFQRNLLKFEKTYNRDGGHEVNVATSSPKITKKEESASCVNVSNDLSFERPAAPQICPSGMPSAADPSPPELDGVSTTAQKPQASTLELQIANQGQQIEELQQKIDEISRLLNETSVGGAYPLAHAPDVVHLVYRESDENLREDGECPEIRKSFVLDHGRLQLETVKMVFGLASVELVIGGKPCVLCANTAGYVPLAFTPNDTHYITGQKMVHPTSTYC